MRKKQAEIEIVYYHDTHPPSALQLIPCICIIRQNFSVPTYEDGEHQKD